jgi:hypothetical protein
MLFDSNGWLIKATYLNIVLSLICYNNANIAGIIIEEASVTRHGGLILRAQVFSDLSIAHFLILLRPCPLPPT